MKRKLRIQICSVKMLYNMLENNKLKEPIAVIMFSEFIERIKDFDNAIYLWFAFGEDVKNGRKIEFTPDISKDISWFINEIEDEITDIYFCSHNNEPWCSALAAAYMRYYGMDEMSVWKNPHYHPHLLAYKFQCKELGKPISAIGLKYRTCISKQALAKAIKRARK